MIRSLVQFSDGGVRGVAAIGAEGGALKLAGVASTLDLALGPELLLGDLPADVRGASRILRDGQVVWEKPFLSGEAKMSHSLDNLEQHHFKYAGFRRPGDVHVHFFGTATLSFSDGFRTQEGDVFEIEAEPFSMPVRNSLRRAAPSEQVKVRAL